MQLKIKIYNYKEDGCSILEQSRQLQKNIDGLTYAIKDRVKHLGDKAEYPLFVLIDNKDNLYGCLWPLPFSGHPLVNSYSKMEGQAIYIKDEVRG